MGEALDDGGGDDRRIGLIAPHSLERRVAGSEVLALDDEDVPLHDVLRRGTGSRQSRVQVAQDLLGLCGDVADADDVPLGIDRVLAADLEGPLAASAGTFDSDPIQPYGCINADRPRPRPRLRRTG